MSTAALLPIIRRQRRPLVNPENGLRWDHPANAGKAPTGAATTQVASSVITFDADAAGKADKQEKDRQAREQAEADEKKRLEEQQQKETKAARATERAKWTEPLLKKQSKADLVKIAVGMADDKDPKPFELATKAQIIKWILTDDK